MKTLAAIFIFMAINSCDSKPVTDFTQLLKRASWTGTVKDASGVRFAIVVDDNFCHSCVDELMQIMCRSESECKPCVVLSATADNYVSAMQMLDLMPKSRCSQVAIGWLPEDQVQARHYIDSLTAESGHRTPYLIFSSANGSTQQLLYDTLFDSAGHLRVSFDASSGLLGTVEALR